MREVVALRRRGGTAHGLSSVVLVLLQAAWGGFLGVVTEVVFIMVVMVGKMA
jgi:nicotinamide riboside transporter PnuC